MVIYRWQRLDSLIFSTFLPRHCLQKLALTRPRFFRVSRNLFFSLFLSFSPFRVFSLIFPFWKGRGREGQRPHFAELVYCGLLFSCFMASEKLRLSAPKSHLNRVNAHQPDGSDILSSVTNCFFLASRGVEGFSEGKSGCKMMPKSSVKLTHKHSLTYIMLHNTFNSRDWQMISKSIRKLKKELQWR